MYRLFVYTAFEFGSSFNWGLYFFVHVGVFGNYSFWFDIETVTVATCLWEHYICVFLAGLLLARAAKSEETPSGPNPYATEERSGGVVLEDVVPPEKNLYNQTWTEEEAKEDANADADGQIQIFDYFSNLDLKVCNFL